jgi:hypothetical protein
MLMVIDVSYAFICVFVTSSCDERDEPLATTYSKSYFDKIYKVHEPIFYLVLLRQLNIFEHNVKHIGA